jgi:hypothetical protein
VDTDADVALLAQVWLGRVKAHPHADVTFRWPLEAGEGELRSDGSLDCAARATEDDEKSIARRLNLSSLMRPNRLAQKAAMDTTDRGKGVVTEVPQQTRRLFDVTEEERDSADGEFSTPHRPPSSHGDGLFRQRRLRKPPDSPTVRSESGTGSTTR